MENPWVAIATRIAKRGVLKFTVHDLHPGRLKEGVSIADFRGELGANILDHRNFSRGAWLPALQRYVELDHSYGLCHEPAEETTITFEEAQARPPHCKCCGGKLKANRDDLSISLQQLGIFGLTCSNCPLPDRS